MEKRNSGATASMVLGLLSVILALVLGTVAPYVPLVLGAVGLVLAVNANKTARSTMASAGFVLSIIGLVISAVFLLMWLLCLGAVSTVVDNALEAS